MKRIIQISLTVMVITVGIMPAKIAWPANPLSEIFSLFQGEFSVTALYEDPGDLAPGSGVYLAQSPQAEKTLIGRVKEISIVAPKTARVELAIEKKYREKLSADTPFVLMSGLFAGKSKAHIVAVSSSKHSDTIPLDPGASVRGVTFLEYKIAAVGGDLAKMMDSIKKQTDDLLTELEHHIETYDTDAFTKKMDDLINKISEFSAEQKEMFRKEILPSLRKSFDSLIKKLEEQNKGDESRALEKKMRKIENMISV